MDRDGEDSMNATAIKLQHRRNKTSKTDWLKSAADRLHEIEEELSKVPTSEVIDELEDCQYDVFTKRRPNPEDDHYVISRDGWSETGIRHFLAAERLYLEVMNKIIDEEEEEMDKAVATR